MKLLSPKAKVQFFYQKTNPVLKNRIRLKTFLISIFKAEKKALKELRVIFSTDQDLLKINREFLQHDVYTDVISFDFSETDATEGEIYISDDRVRENAQSGGVAIEIELHRVIFHGVLHLCGYGDKSKAEKARMRAKEDFYLGKYFGKRFT